jgi:hypothetical protein
LLIGIDNRLNIIVYQSFFIDKRFPVAFQAPPDVQQHYAALLFDLGRESREETIPVAS